MRLKGPIPFILAFLFYGLNQKPVLKYCIFYLQDFKVLTSELILMSCHPLIPGIGI